MNLIHDARMSDTTGNVEQLAHAVDGEVVKHSSLRRKRTVCSSAQWAAVRVLPALSVLDSKKETRGIYANGQDTHCTRARGAYAVSVGLNSERSGEVIADKEPCCLHPKLVPINKLSVPKFL